GLVGHEDGLYRRAARGDLVGPRHSRICRDHRDTDHSRLLLGLLDRVEMADLGDGRQRQFQLILGAELLLVVRGGPIVTSARRIIAGIAAVSTAVLLLAFQAPAHALLPPPPPMVPIIVQQWNFADPAAKTALGLLGGTVTRDLPVINGFAAN